VCPRKIALRAFVLVSHTLIVPSTSPKYNRKPLGLRAIDHAPSACLLIVPVQVAVFHVLVVINSTNSCGRPVCRRANADLLLL